MDIVLLNYCLSHMGIFGCLRELRFFPCENESEAEKVVAKILALPIGKRLWPNWLNRPIRNASFVDVAEFSNKMSKAIVKHDGDTIEGMSTKGTASRLRSKKAIASSSRQWL